MPLESAPTLTFIQARRDLVHQMQVLHWLITPAGARVLGQTLPPLVDPFGQGTEADGQDADGQEIGWGWGALDIRGDVTDLGSLRTSQLPWGTDQITAIGTREQTSLSVQATNVDKYWSRIAAREPVLGQRWRVQFYYSGSIWLWRWDGIVQRWSIDAGTVQFELIEA